LMCGLQCSTMQTGMQATKQAMLTSSRSCQCFAVVSVRLLACFYATLLDQ
jgi:hypothetical protein